MLPKKNRLSRKEFGLLRSGATYRSRLLTLRLVRGGSAVKFAFTVSKKAFKDAVSRNKARRRGYAAIGGLFPRLLPAVGAFSLNPGLGMPSVDDLASDIEALLGKVGVLK